ncbi:MAG: hypothetical protein K8R02_04160 [Anaerohalosphaeraceae bacterium]|nr:hypothetical protein [Anaerohalosphaeraceae bacterium]
MRYFLTITILTAVDFLCGCQEATLVDTNNIDTIAQSQCIFTAEKIKLTQLTEFVETWKIVAYIDVLDGFGSRIKTSGIWRFELYDYTPRSAEPKGGRLYLWEDIALTDAEMNNNNWQDFMRSYKFTLEMDTEQATGKTYILSVTCLTAQGKRLVDSVHIKL